MRVWVVGWGCGIFGMGHDRVQSLRPGDVVEVTVPESGIQNSILGDSEVWVVFVCDAAS
jgi:hypothetical protein